MNVDDKVVESFGEEWTRFDQSSLAASEVEEMFESYFRIFPWSALPKEAVGFDMGCGSGRWAAPVASRVHKLICIDGSAKALKVAEKNLAQLNNVEFMNAYVDTCSIEENSMDFGYSLGVLHHIPDTQAGIFACVKKLKVGAPFLLYIYYAFDNRPVWYEWLWKLSEIFRSIISRLPSRLRYFASDCMAVFVYWPLSRMAGFLEKKGVSVKNFPLATYRSRSFYTLRTDALDRFGTRLEKRFTRNEIKNMMEQAGLENIVFSDQVPFWVAVGYKRN